MKKIVRKLLKRPVLWGLLFSIIVVACGLFFGSACFYTSALDVIENIGLSILCGIPIGGLFVLPLVLTAMNLGFAVISRKNDLVRNSGRKTETSTLIIGVIYTGLYSHYGLIITEILRLRGREELVVETEWNTPIALWTLPTVMTFVCFGIAGYIILRCENKRVLTPALEVFAIAGIYIGAATCAMWSVQVIKGAFLLSLLPINFILICFKLICETVADGRENGESSEIEEKVQRILMKSANLPWLALPAAFLLLGVTIAVLMLFGQKPDSIIQAWTQTTGWTLSQPVQ